MKSLSLKTSRPTVVINALVVSQQRFGLILEINNHTQCAPCTTTHNHTNRRACAQSHVFSKATVTIVQPLGTTVT